MTLDYSAFAASVQDELERARSKHAPIHNLHEGYAVLLEEVDELWDSVRASNTNHQGDLDAYKELVQIGAMAQRIAEDVIDAKAVVISASPSAPPQTGKEGTK